jgi:RNase adaptor protein for sRNA GlmZ degradation
VLRQHIGQDEKVGEYIMKDPILEKSWEQISSLIVTLNPEYKKERKSYLTVTFG